jgi:hypothetical protein
MEHQNCCTDLRHPELLAACCPYSSVHGKLVVQPVQNQKSWKTAAFALFQFFDPTSYTLSITPSKEAGLSVEVVDGGEPSQDHRNGKNGAAALRQVRRVTRPERASRRASEPI